MYLCKSLYGIFHYFVICVSSIEVSILGRICHVGLVSTKYLFVWTNIEAEEKEGSIVNLNCTKNGNRQSKLHQIEIVNLNYTKMEIVNLNCTKKWKSSKFSNIEAIKTRTWALLFMNP